MPKTRKTRKQKIQHDQKKPAVHDMTPSEVSSSRSQAHQTEQTPVATETYSLPTNETKTPTATVKAKETPLKVTVSTTEYGYLSNDLMRTALLTGAIVFAELVIRMFVVR
jgi:hypothetical protein